MLEFTEFGACNCASLIPRFHHLYFEQLQRPPNHQLKRMREFKHSVRAAVASSVCAAFAILLHIEVAWLQTRREILPAETYPPFT